jgi:3-oxoacyl-[acyl-carrier protein] reductase
VNTATFAALGVPNLDGQTALVTGAARRLGRHLALTLARAGADVVVHYNASRAEADAVCAEIARIGKKSWAIAADFLDESSVEAMMNEVARGPGRLSIVVNNVGNYLVKDVEETTTDEWRRLMEANLLAPITIIRRAIGLFPPAGGSIVNLGYAGVEHITVASRAAAYQASKTALYLATKAFAQSLAPKRIRVNMISPGQLENSVDLPPDLEKVIPLGRAGTLDDIAKTVLFLLDPSSYLTGINIDVAGGYRMGMVD